MSTRPRAGQAPQRRDRRRNGAHGAPGRGSRHGQSGLTLVELLVSVLLFAILSAGAMMWLSGQQQTSVGQQRAQQLQDWLRTAVADTEHMRHGDLVAKALRASFGVHHSAVEAAAAAGMAPTTLKRYRKLGVLQITAMARQK